MGNRAAGWVAWLGVTILCSSGCLGASSNATKATDGTNEPASTHIVEAEKGVFVADNRGVLRGNVLNDAGFNLSGVRVSILGSDRFVVTTGEGTFLFENLTVGSHTVRAEAKGFQAYENDTKIAAGRLTKLAIQLVPDVDTGAGYRPHTHDFWADRTEMTILDADQDFLHPTSTNGGAAGSGYLYQAQAMAVYPNSNASDTSRDFLVKIPSEGDPPALVYPGTREVDVTVSWTGSSSTAYKVELKHASAAHYGDNRVTLLDRRVSGSTWRIPVGPDDWDSGHQHFTLWRFWVNAYQEPGDGANFRPGVILGNFHVMIKVLKGQLVPERAHENWWGARTELVLRDLPDGSADCNSAYRIFERQEHPCILGLPKGRIVPPGTEKLRVEMKWTYGTDNAALDPLASDWVIMYRSAAQNPWIVKPKEFNAAETKGSTPKLRTTEILIKPGESDAFYQTSSLWRFTYAVRGHERDDFDYEARQGAFSIRVVAMRDPSFAGGGM
jgi:hypothetical protein